MKKVLAFSLALLLVFAAVVPVFAATPRNSCVHNYQLVHESTSYVYIDIHAHMLYNFKTYVCSICNHVKQEKFSRSARLSHSSVYTDATCTGTTQTIKKYCSVCVTTYSYTQSCPKGPHTGNCPALPI